MARCIGRRGRFRCIEYGFRWPYREQMIYRYLDCGDLHNRFARFWKMPIIIGYPHLNSISKAEH